MILLSESRGNTKLRKSETEEYRILGLSLDPGSVRVCPHATTSCRISCVGKSGLARVFTSIEESRQRKTAWYFADRPKFMAQLHSEIEREQRLAEYDNEQLILRLNTYSDLNWADTARRFSGAIFYDYTKINTRWEKIQRGDWPQNYYLTFSWSEDPRHQEACCRILSEGGNVAIPFANPGRGFCGHGAYRQQLPGFWTIGGVRAPVWDGDESDLRFTDPAAGDWRNPTPGRGWLVGLRLKAHNQAERQQSIDSGFAVTYVP